MLESIYIFFSVLGFSITLFSFLRVDGFMWEICPFLAAIIFFILGISSFDIANTTCQMTSNFNPGSPDFSNITDEWNCHTTYTREPGLGYLFYGLGILNLVYGIVMIFYKVASRGKG